MTEAVPNPLLTTIVDAIDYPDSDSAQAVGRQLSGPAGSLGVLAELASWTAGVQGRCPPQPFRTGRLVLFAGDHGIAASEVSPYPVETTAQQLARLRDGGGILNVLADATGVGIRLVDIAVEADTEPAISTWKVRRSSGRIDQLDALSIDEARAGIEAGAAIADREIDAGADLLIAADLGAGNRTAAATLISVLTDTEPIRVAGKVGIGEQPDDASWIRNCAAIRDARRRAWSHRGEPTELLAVAAGADLAAMTGFLLQAARRRTPVLLDGLVVCAAALVAQLASPRVVRWFQAAHLSPEPAHGIALQRLGLTPIVQLGIWRGQGSGALLALPILRTAALVVTG